MRPFLRLSGTLVAAGAIVVALGLGGMRMSAAQAQVQQATVSAIVPARTSELPPPAGWIRLPGEVVPALASATPVIASPRSAREPMTITLTLKRDNESGFNRYLADVYDPHSPAYHHFLTQAQLAQRFGPSRHTYRELLGWLHSRGLHTVQKSGNRLTLTVRGTRADVEHAFAVRIGDYKIGHSAGLYANDINPALPAGMAGHVIAVSGLSNFAEPQPGMEKFFPDQCKQNPQVCKGLDWLISTPAYGYSCFAAYGALFKALNGIAAGGSALTMYSEAQQGYIYLQGAFGLGAVGMMTSALNKGKGLFPGAMGVVNKFNPCLHFANNLGLYNGGSKGGGPSGWAPMGGPRAASVRAAPSSSVNANGAGQTIGLLEFDAFNQSDVLDYLNLLGDGGNIGNLSVVPVNGGISSPGSGVDEVLLDIDTVMSIAPGAKVVVYEAPFNGQVTSYTQALNAMVNGGVTVISISWASCENQVSQADADAVDAVLKSAAASGISVFAGSGDTGSTCLDGSPNTMNMPADSPNVTAVGGTSLANGPLPLGAYAPEVWWNGSQATQQTGQGGYGVSQYFSKPAYQDSLNSGTMRSVPDVAILADPQYGIRICDANNGGCPTSAVYGGTSMAAPEWAAIAALINQAQGHNLGAFNPLLYPLAGSAAFHDAASMGSDFAHVGLGSPNINALDRLLKGQTLGVPDPNQSLVTPLINVATAGMVNVNGTPTFMTAADGSTQAEVEVQLEDANGNAVAGKQVTLSASSANVVVTPSGPVTTDANGVAIFDVTDLTPETVTFTATDTTDNVQLANTASLLFAVPPATSASLNVFPTSVTADGQSTATLTVTLKDALGRPTPDTLVSISQGDGHSVISGPSPAVTDSNGQIQFTVTDDQDETVTYTATDVSDGNLPIPGSGTNVTFGSATASDCTTNPPSAATGFVLAPVASGFPAGDFSFNGVNVPGCPGVGVPTFLPSGSMLIPDAETGSIYSLPLSGGAVSPSEIVGNAGIGIGGFVQGKDGNFYTATTGLGNAVVEQINPSTGAVIRTLASGLTCPGFLTVDPISGDFFFDGACNGSGTDPNLYRISNPYGSNPTVSVYATLPGSVASGGIAIAPNGTIYVNAGNGSFFNGWIDEVTGTSGPQPATVTQLPNIVANDFGLAIGQANPDGSAKTLLIAGPGLNGSNTLETVDIATGAVITVMARGGDMGTGVIGPDGCNYQPSHHVLYRLGPASGQCGLTPTSVLPSLVLSPATVSPNPQQGDTQTFTATLKNVSSPAGMPVLFTVSGANTQVKIVDTNASGQAALTYQAVSAGTDTVVAHANVPSATTAPAATSAPGAPSTQALSSNAAQVVWAAGAHVTFLSLNSSPASATTGQAVTLAAQLYDQSASPIVPLAGQSVQLAVGSQSCTATTDTNGGASCSVTLTTLGSATLTASFAGVSGSYSAASASKAFNVSAVPAAASTPPPPPSPPTPLPPVENHASSGGGGLGLLGLLFLGLIGLMEKRRRH